jgi:hypothetical protein
VARVAVVATILGTWLLTAPLAFAADPTFGEAIATAKFGDAIVVEQPATLPEAPHRIEAVVRAGNDSPTFLADIPSPGAGSTTLRYRYPTPFGSLYPNTRVEVGFRVTLDDGRVIDSPTTRIRYEDDRFAWRTLEGPLVRIHWAQGGDQFGERALQIGERAVEEATALLGVEETQPIDFFVYGDRSAFQDVLGPALQENVGGIALSEIRTMFANIEPAAVNDAWVGIVIPHELTHLVFNTATGNPYHAPPHWLNEGLAVYLSEGYNAPARASVERAVRSNEIMPLGALVARFPSTAERFSLAYDESVSAIDYLIRTHGQDALVSLIRSYAGGVSDDAAFTAALGVDLAGFEAGWQADLGIEEPPAFGPQPAPPGPLPPGWNAPPTPGPGESVRPIPTGGPSEPGDGDISGPILIAGIGLVVMLLVAGLVIVARGLSRGDPLLPPMGAPQPDDAHDGHDTEPGSDPDDTTDGNEP